MLIVTWDAPPHEAKFVNCWSAPRPSSKIDYNLQTASCSAL